MARLEVGVLGEPRVEVDGVAVALGPHRNARLLALLALARGATVDAARLADVLWNGTPPAKWETSVQSRVSRLRAALGDAAAQLVTRPGGYALELEPGCLDVERFERMAAAGHQRFVAGDAAGAVEHLEAALACWRGALDGWTGDAGGPERIALEDQRATATETLGATRLELGDAAPVIPDLERHVAEHPYRERGWVLLARALHASGRTADALRRIAFVREMLRDELGIEPGRDLRELELAILDGDDGLARPSRRPILEVSSAAVAVALPAWLREPRDRFVGRHAEAERVAAAWTAVMAGELRVVVIEGEPGIGKTRLAARAVTSCEPAAPVLAGRCDVDPLLAYQPFAEMVAPLLADRDRVRALAPELPALALIAPDLAIRVPGVALTDVGDSEAARLAAAHGLAQLRAEAFGSAPIVVVIDDVQWITTEALRLLRIVVRSGALGAALVLLTARDSERTRELDDAVLGWQRDRLLDTVRVAPLAGEDAQALAIARGVSDELATRACARAGGNPFYVEEIVRHLVEEGDDARLPATVRATVHQRVERLPTATRDLLDLAAVVGFHFDGALLAATARLELDDVFTALADATRAGLLREVEGTRDAYDFAHALVRDALLEQLGARRTVLHAAVADTLEREVAAPASARLGALTFHATEAVVDGLSARRALTCARREAYVAFERAGADDALRMLATAIERATPHLAPDDPDLLATRIDHAAMIGRLGATEEAMALALAVADECLRAREDVLAAVALECAESWTSIRWQELDRRWAVVAERLVDRDDDHRLIADAHRADGEDLSIEDAVARADDLLERLRRRERPAVVHAVVVLAAATMVEGVSDPEPYLASIRDAVKLVDGSRDLTRVMGIASSARAMHMVAGDLDRAAELAEYAERLALRYKVPRFLAGIEQRRAMYAILEGRFADADTHARAAIEIQPTTEMLEGFTVQFFAKCKQQGSLHEIVDAVAEFVERDPRPAWHAGHAMVLASVGRADDARVALEPVIARARDLHAQGWWPWHGAYGMTALALTADTAALLDDAALARSVLTDLECVRAALAFLPATVACLGSFDHHRGRLHAICGDHANAAHAFERSLALHERLGARPFVARDRFGLADALVALGAPSDDARVAELRRTARAIARELALRDPVTMPNLR